MVRQVYSCRGRWVDLGGAPARQLRGSRWSSGHVSATPALTTERRMQGRQLSRHIAMLSLGVALHRANDITSSQASPRSPIDG